jgi:Domain of unknown function (DUF1707)/2TM domain
MAALRASDRDRERAAETLRDAAAEGRLQLAELEERLEAAYTARTDAELAALTSDLPAAARPRRSWLGWSQALRGELPAFILVNALLVVVWAATGAGYFWPAWPILGWGIGLVRKSRRRDRPELDAAPGAGSARRST